MYVSDLYSYILRTFIRTDKETAAYEAMSDTLRDIKKRTKLKVNSKVSAALSITALGDYKIALPSDFGKLIGDDVRIIDNDSSYILTKISKNDFDKLEANPDYASVSKSKPTHYCIFNNYLYLFPVPDSIAYTYKMNYVIGTETEITSAIAAATDIGLADDDRELVKYGVLYRLYRDLGNDNDMMKYKALYDEEMRVLESRDKSNTEPTLIMEPNEYF